MPHVISQTQEDDICLSEDKIPKEEKPNKENLRVLESCRSLVMVRSHYRKVPQSKKIFKTNVQKKKTMPKETRGRRSMDIASFKEIRRIQQLENEALKAIKSPCNQAAVDEWNGFWSMASTMEKKKKKKPLTVIQSKEKKLEKARSHHFETMHDMHNPDLYL